MILQMNLQKCEWISGQDRMIPSAFNARSLWLWALVAAIGGHLDGELFLLLDGTAKA